MTKILFVCLGNICRSPMAEGLLRKRIAIEGREAEFLWILLLQARMKLERHRTLERKKNIKPRKSRYDEYGCSANHTPRF